MNNDRKKSFFYKLDFPKLSNKYFTHSQNLKIKIDKSRALASFVYSIVGLAPFLIY